MEESPLTKFQNSLNFILNLRNDGFADRFENIFLGQASQARTEYIKKNFKETAENCVLLSNYFGRISDNYEQASILIDDFNDYTNGLIQSLSSTSLNIVITTAFIDNIKSCSEKLISNFIIRKRFHNVTRSVDTEAKNYLCEYAKSAVIIRSDESYISSPFAELENLVLDPKETIIRLLGEDSLFDNHDGLDYAFIALAAPSFEGKTQSAFVMEKVVPLYFPVIVPDPFQAHDTQAIYRNFSNLSKSIQEYALHDYNTISRIESNRQSTTTPASFEIVSRSEISSNLRNVPLLVLGFLVALTDHSRREYFDLPVNQRSGSWMEYHACRNGFDFQAISTNEFEESGFSFGNFFLFLDEFNDADWTLLIRNIARAVKLRCMVSNTDTNVASLTGRNNVLFFRGNPDHVLSIVVRRLNRINFDILTSLFPRSNGNLGLSGKINQIISSTHGAMDNSIICNFFESFKNELLNHLRPGIAILVAKIILRYNSTSSSLESFLSCLIAELSAQIKSRKRRIGTYLGLLGTFGLMMFNAYDASIRLRALNVFHRKTYLKNHLYYLINPQNDQNKWFFLTYPAAVSEVNPNLSESSPVLGSQTGTRVLEPELLFDFNESETNGNGNEPNNAREQESPHQLRILIGHDLVNWNHKMTYFRAEEWLTSLACIFMSSDASIFTILEHGMQEIRRNPSGTGDTRITEYESVLNGNELEVLMTVWVLDASHHDYGVQKSSFKGQKGINFLKNLICNMMNQLHCRRHDRVVINFNGSSELEAVLKNMHVPFLFPSNCKLPSILLPCSRARFFHKISMHVGKFERTLNSRQIDAKFQYFNLKRQRGQIPTLPTCIIECKNWRADVYISHLKSILLKFRRRKSSKFGFIICNSLGGYEAEALTDFLVFLRSNKINLYRLKYLPIADYQRRHFSLEPFHVSLPFFVNFNINCIILELSEINHQ